MRLPHILAVALSATLVALGNARADGDEAAETVARHLPDYMVRQINDHPRDFMAKMSRRLHEISQDGIATAEAIDIAARRSLAHERAKLVGSILRQDLDGDGALSREEIALVASGSGSLVRHVVTQADTDKDGAVSTAELMAYAGAEAEAKLRRSPWERPEQLQLFDLDGNGTVVLSEISRVFNAVRSLRLGVPDDAQDRRGGEEPERRPLQRDATFPDPDHFVPPLRGDRRGFATDRRMQHKYHFK